MDYQAVVHRQSGTIHRSPVMSDLSVTKTLCGRVLGDMWVPVSDGETTCLKCLELLIHRATMAQGKAVSDTSPEPLSTFYTRDSEGDRAFEEGVAVAMEQASGQGDGHAKGASPSTGSDSETPAHVRHRSPWPEAVALLTAWQQYTDGKLDNGLVYHDVLKPWLDDFLLRSAGEPEAPDSTALASARHYSFRPEAFNPDDAIGYALLETEHLPGFARRGSIFREKLAEAGWEIRKVSA